MLTLWRAAQFRYASHVDLQIERLEVPAVLDEHVAVSRYHLKIGQLLYDKPTRIFPQ